MKAKDLSNEELAIILRCMTVTGIASSVFERECLDVAADRVELLELITSKEEKDVKRH